MVDRIVKHKPVGEELDKDEWESEEVHELATGSVLLISQPPSKYHKVYNLYARKTGDKYHPVIVVETEPEP